MEKDNGPDFKYKVIGFFIFILLVILMYNWPFGGTEEVSTDSSKDYKLDAYVMSQEFMDDYLKAPSTAKYPWYSEINVVQTGNRYKVEAYVDSDNSFGTKIRTKYYMILERDSDGGWTKISCDIK